MYQHLDHLPAAIQFERRRGAAHRSQRRFDQADAPIGARYARLLGGDPGFGLLHRAVGNVLVIGIQRRGAIQSGLCGGESGPARFGFGPGGRQAVAERDAVGRGEARFDGSHHGPVRQGLADFRPFGAGSARATAPETGARRTKERDGSSSRRPYATVSRGFVTAAKRLRPDIQELLHFRGEFHDGFAARALADMGCAPDRLVALGLGRETRPVRQEGPEERPGDRRGSTARTM